MSRVNLKGIHKVKKKLASGKVVEYHYLRGGPKFWGPDSGFQAGSEEYIAAYSKAGRSRREKAVPRIRSVIIKYKQSDAYTRLAPRTQSDYDIWLARIDEEFGDAPIKAFNNPQIRDKAFQFRDKWTGRQAQYAWSTLARLCSWGYDRGILDYHHLRSGGSVYKADRSDIIWTPADCQAFLKIAPVHVRHAFTTAIETGLRRGDLVQLSESHLEDTPKGRRIVIKTSKKKRIAAIPISPAMAEVIAAKPKDQIPILANGDGNPWSKPGISRAIKRWSRNAGLSEDLRLNDARGTACTKLLLAGLTVSQIALHMGWSIETAARMIEVYAHLNTDETDAVLVKLAEFRK